jgi:hypothetical protein
MLAEKKRKTQGNERERNKCEETCEKSRENTRLSAMEIETHNGKLEHKNRNKQAQQIKKGRVY